MQHMYLYTHALLKTLRGSIRGGWRRQGQNDIDRLQHLVLSYHSSEQGQRQERRGQGVGTGGQLTASGLALVSCSCSAGSQFDRFYNTRWAWRLRDKTRLSAASNGSTSFSSHPHGSKSPNLHLAHTQCLESMQELGFVRHLKFHIADESWELLHRKISRWRTGVKQDRIHRGDNEICSISAEKWFAFSFLADLFVRRVKDCLIAILDHWQYNQASPFFLHCAEHSRACLPNRKGGVTDT